MLAELQNQRIRRRSEGRSSGIAHPRFSLIVNGKTKGVWEKTTIPAFSIKKIFVLPFPDLNKISGFLKKNLHMVLVISGVLLLALLTIMFIQIIKHDTLPQQHATDPVSEEAAAYAIWARESNPVASGSQRTMSVFGVRLSSYTVKRGDTLENIASRNNVNLSTLISYNNIKEARTVTVGKVLQIPNKPGLRYRTVKGDTLSGIANRFKIEIDDLLDWNNLKTSTLRTGQELFIPNARLSSADVNRVMGMEYVWPTQGKLSSPYGMRLSPITGTWQFHNGIDIHNAMGTAIVAARAGRVAIVDYNPTYGNYVIIIHDDGVQTLYGHLDRITVVRNQRVAQREKIGNMGNTGASTGPHLHFSIFLRRDTHVDPLKYLPR
ncbi:MAG: M23 family metallopeptidase [Spirochaetaceae bacterium]|nr:MAG: M23 family metallopeptidase [Spirochaetaceae bacterium]